MNRNEVSGLPSVSRLCCAWRLIFLLLQANQSGSFIATPFSAWLTLQWLSWASCNEKASFNFLGCFNGAFFTTWPRVHSVITCSSLHLLFVFCCLCCYHVWHYWVLVVRHALVVSTAKQQSFNPFVLIITQFHVVYIGIYMDRLK